MSTGLDICSLSFLYLLIACSPSSDATILTSRKYNLLLVKEAKRAHNLLAVGTRHAHAVFLVQHPFLLRILGQKVQLKHLLAFYS